MKDAAGIERTCVVCGAPINPIQPSGHRRTGRPRVTCSPECHSLKRNQQRREQRHQQQEVRRG